MKKILLGLVLLFNLISQASSWALNRMAYQVGFYLHSSTNNLYSVGVGVAYHWGAGSNCPALGVSRYYLSNDTMHLNLFYDISGAWQTFGCARLDTVSFSGPTVGVAYLHVTYAEFFWEPSDSTLHDTSSVWYDTTFVLKSTGMAELSFENSISVAPNPSTGKINLESLTEDFTECRIFNSIGQLSYSKSISGKSNSIDISKLPKGIYQLRLQSKHGRIIIRKLILL